MGGLTDDDVDDDDPDRNSMVASIGPSVRSVYTHCNRITELEF